MGLVSGPDPACGPAAQQLCLIHWTPQFIDYSPVHDYRNKTGLGPWFETTKVISVLNSLTDYCPHFVLLSVLQRKRGFSFCTFYKQMKTIGTDMWMVSLLLPLKKKKNQFDQFEQP